MTKEEKQKAIDALKISAPIKAVTQEEFNDYIQILNKIMDWLEQKPTDKNFTKADIDAIVKAISTGWELRVNELLDKIRAEIEELPTKTRINWDGCCPDIDYPEIEYVDATKNELLEIINKYKLVLEPLEQEPKTGHWIDDKCSVCGKGTEDLISSREWYRNEEPNFCPFCGVQLESEDNKVKNPMEQTLDFLKNLYLQNKEEIDRVAKEYKVIEANKAESEE